MVQANRGGHLTPGTAGGDGANGAEAGASRAVKSCEIVELVDRMWGGREEGRKAKDLRDSRPWA